MNNWTRKNKREPFYVIRRGFEVWGMGYVVWGLWYEVWGLGFGEVLSVGW